MRKKFKYFNLNKQIDFEKGTCFGGVYFDKELRVSSDKSGVYYSGILDSRKSEISWYKMIIDCDIPVNTFCRISVYSSDSRNISVNGEADDISNFLKCDIAENEKENVLRKYNLFESSMKKNILLTKVIGRYLWFKLELSASGDTSPAIKGIKIYFDYYSWINYLPEIYRTENTGFTERFLDIFQEIYEVMENKIEKTILNYTVENSDLEFLQWLADWYCIREKNLWNENQLCYILANAKRIYSLMGTKKIIEELCELYLGEKPLIIEYYMKDKTDLQIGYKIEYDRIFLNPYVFTVIVNESKIKNNSRYISLVKIIESCKPVHMEANIIVVEDEGINKSGYIGINSYITERSSDYLTKNTSVMSEKNSKEGHLE